MARTLLLPLNSNSIHFRQATISASGFGVSCCVGSTGCCSRLLKLNASARNYSNLETRTPSSNTVEKGMLDKGSDIDQNQQLKFSHIFCDMDGTLLNSKGLISPKTAEALKEATSRGIKVVIATGKSRPAAKIVLEKAGLTGKEGVFSDTSPGVFIQGLVVYGRNGQKIYRRNLDPSICREACIYSLEHNVPLVAFCENTCLTLFDHPLVDYLQTAYHEPVEIVPSVDQLLKSAQVQKLIFMDTVEGVANSLRPYWSKAAGGRARVVQAVADILEIVPPGSSKGSGVRILLEHLGVSENEVMAIGDGENDMEMLELAGLGVALSNGSEQAKAVADVIGISNDEDGAADAIYRYAL
ncbi:unnamed protein product [Rhodiola kirilowii]